MVFFSCYLGSLDPIFVVQASFTRSVCVASTDYQRCLVSLKLMTSQVVQIARPLTGRIYPLRAQRVNTIFQTYSKGKACIRAKWHVRPELIPVSVA